MPNNSKGRGFRYDPTTNRMQVLFNGTEVMDFDDNDIVFTAAATLSGAQVFADDTAVSLGTGGTADILWETADANANELIVDLPAGGSTDVPVVVVGDTISGADLGQYNGVVSTTLALHGSTATATGPSLTFKKSRGTNTAPTVVTSADDMGSIDFYGAVAANEYVRGARILAEMTGTIATTRGPGVLTFQTATDAAPSVLTTAMSISAAQVTTFSGTVALGANNLTMTGTIAATGARVTQAYFTNQTTTNAETVDSSETVKHEIDAYTGDALNIVRDLDIITFKHDEWLDPSGELKLGIRAESVKEPLAVRMIERPDQSYPGVNMYGLSTLLARAVQQLTEKVERLETALA